MKILVTGGAGYISSHTCILLQQAGYDLVVVDNLSNSTIEVIGRIEELSGRAAQLVEDDVRDGALIRRVWSRGVKAVVHLAALKSIGESCAGPLEHNIGGIIALQAIEEARGACLVFLSSASTSGLRNIPLGCRAWFFCDRDRADVQEGVGQAGSVRYCRQAQGRCRSVDREPVKTQAVLGWTRKFDLEAFCRDAWRWQTQAGDVNAH